MSKKIEDMEYEETYSELEKLVETLEGEQLSLEQTINLFEKGKNLIQHCQDLLDKAELKVTQLTSQEIDDLSENVDINAK